MAAIRVGDKECSFNKIIIEIRKCRSYSGGDLDDGWKLLGNELDVKQLLLTQLAKKLLLGIFTLDEVITKLLVDWVSRLSKEATLASLAESFENIEMKDVADALKDKFLKGKDSAPPPPNLVVQQNKQMEFLKSIFSLGLNELTYYEDVEVKDGQCFPKPKQDEDVIDFRTSSAMQVSVTKPKSPMIFEKDYYKLPYGSKGFALVLNIREYKRGIRRGAEYDSFYMEQLWKQLGYEVRVEDKGMFDKARVKQILKEFRATVNKEATPSIVVFIGGHGESGNLILSNETDDDKMHIFGEIVYQFDRKHCKHLHKKPKMFILSACQEFEKGEAFNWELLQDQGSDQEKLECVGGQGDDGEKDARQKMSIDHTIVCYSTLPGYFSYRYAQLGTAYIFCLTKVFMEEAHKFHLLKMLDNVKDIMEKIKTYNPINQAPTFQPIGIKKLYFNMKPEN